MRTLICIYLLAFSAQAQQVFNVKDFGAKGDGRTDDAPAIQRTIDHTTAAGGGRVYFPAGTFLSGPLFLKSNIEIHLDGAATLLANPDERVYTHSAFRENPGEGTIWIGGEHIENVAFSGTGEINGNGISFMGKELDEAYELKPFQIVDPRPHLLTLVDGKNIRIRDLRITNSAYWTLHLAGCNDVVISGITLLNSLKVRNSDGIDIDHSKNVRISDCYIESGDDCICLKNRREYQEFGRCENITVANCTMTSRSCAIKIGSENMDTIRQVVFNNCIIKDSNRGIGIQNRDEGVVHDVIFSNMIVEGRLFSDVWWGKAEPIYVTAYRRANINHKDANWRFPKGVTEGRVGEIRNIYFSNIQCTSENGAYVSGESPEKIQNVYFDQVNITLRKSTAIPGGVYDRRPCQAEGFETGRTSGIYINGAQHMQIKNSSVKWIDPKPAYFAYAIECVHTSDVAITGFTGNAAFPSRMKAVIMK